MRRILEFTEEENVAFVRASNAESMACAITELKDRLVALEDGRASVVSVASIIELFEMTLGEYCE